MGRSAGRWRRWRARRRSAQVHEWRSRHRVEYEERRAERDPRRYRVDGRWRITYVPTTLGPMWRITDPNGTERLGLWPDLGAAFNATLALIRAEQEQAQRDRLRDVFCD